MLIFVSACSSTEEDDGTDVQTGIGTSAASGTSGGSGVSGSDGNGPFGGGEIVDVGSFNVELRSSKDPNISSTTNVQGKVCDAPPIAGRMLAWELTAEEEGCQLLEPHAPFCDPPCEQGLTCIEDNQCVSPETCFDLGTVTLQGLQTETGENLITLTPIKNVYQVAGVRLVYPPFSEGTPIRIETTGGELDAFSIESTGIAPLELLMDGDVLVAPDQPITLEWVPAGPTGKSRIEVRLDISHHGGQKGEIVCDIEDIGSFNVPASLVTQLLNLGIAGYPVIEIMRVAIGTVVTSPGRVLLKMQTIESRQVQIPGLVSCSNDSDCPSGQACLDSFMCG